MHRQAYRQLLQIALLCPLRDATRANCTLGLAIFMKEAMKKTSLMGDPQLL
jgi:hypothetical protein